MRNGQTYSAGIRSVVRRLLMPSVIAMLLCSPASGSAQTAPLDHFMCYTISAPAPNKVVLLKDQFGEAEANVLRAIYFCNPTVKIFGGVTSRIVNRNNHLKWYNITTPTSPRRKIEVRNQFGVQQMTVTSARWLAVPTQKDTLPKPEGLDHFKCYTASGLSISKPVTLHDQFERDENFQVLKPVRFCNPVAKIHDGVVTEPRNPEAHLACYDVARPVRATNQFGNESFVVRKMFLCVPSQKRVIG